MQEICGAASDPSDLSSSTLSRVPSRVEPPAPKVTEKNAGLNCASCLRAMRSFSIPAGVFGGKNSKLKVREADSIPGPLTESISVMIRLVRPLDCDTDIRRLFGRQLGEHRAELLELQAG